MTVAVLVGLACPSALAGAIVQVQLALAAFADTQVTKVWSNPAGGPWQNGGNWSPVGVPAEEDSVRFVASTSGPVTLGADVLVHDVVVQAGTVAVALNGNAFSTFGFPFDGYLRVGTAAGQAASLTLTGPSASFDTPNIAIATVPGSVGTLTCVNLQTFVPPSLIDVGQFGDGALVVSNASMLTCNQLRVALAPGASGMVTIDSGSSILCPGGALVGNGDLILLDGGSLHSSTGVSIFPDSTATGDGTVVLSGCALGRDLPFANFGSLFPGDGFGTFHVVGNYEQFGIVPGLGFDSGALVIEATTEGGPVVHDDVAVTCVATLGGLLHLTPVDAFDPPVGTEMPVLTASDLVSTFDVVLVPGLPDKFIAVEYEPGEIRSADGASVTLVVKALEGGVAFGGPALAALEGEPRAIAPGDIDGDGDLSDLAMVIPDSNDPLGTPGTLVILFDVAIDPKTAALTFASSATIETGLLPTALAVGDIDLNGSDDVAIANTASDTVQVYFSERGGVAASVVIPVGDQPMAVCLGKLDGEDGLDIGVAEGGENEVLILGYAGGFGFEELGQLLAGAVPCDVDPSDIDLDGDNDIVVANFASSNVTTYLNNGKGAFEPGPVLAVGDGPVDSVAADLDGDGYPEIVTSNLAGATVSILKSLGRETPEFAPSVDLPIGAVGSLIGSLAILDLGEDSDAQGDPDIVVIASDGDDPDGPRVVRFLRNDSPPGGDTITFASAATLDTGGDALVITAADVTDNGAPDLVVLNAPSDGVAGGRGGSSLAAIPTLPPGDLDADGVVGPIDLAILLGAWGTPGPGDLDGGGDVGPADLAILLGAWTLSS